MKVTTVLGEGLEQVFRVEADNIIGHDGTADPCHRVRVVQRVDMAAGHNEGTTSSVLKS